MQVDLEVTRFEQRPGNVWLIDLARPDGGKLPEFAAGAHLDLYVGPALVRPYSLWGNPTDRHRYRLGILRDPDSRGGSEVICSQWGMGMPVRASVPRNLFPLVEEARHSVLVGGGIGITPLIAMALRLRALGASFELHYCVRNPESAAFLPEVQNTDLAAFAQIHFSQDARFSLPIHVGHPADSESHLYVCGPHGFMDQVLADARVCGWGAEQLHWEQFSAEMDLSGAPFSVKLSDGTTIEVPAGQSIAHCLISAGHEIEVSCEQGICGTCIVDVIDGHPEHRDHYLTEEERTSNALIATCCSRAAGSLTIAFP